MNGRQLEEAALKRFEQEEAARRATAGRYGVQVAVIAGDLQPMKSLPDIEGVLHGGRQFIFECKVCSAASLPMDYLGLGQKIKLRQIRHLQRRARFGVIAFLLIHWNERNLKTRIDPAVTYALPVALDHPLWEKIESREILRITRDDCDFYGVEVPWNTLPGKRRELPDVLTAIRTLVLLDEAREELATES